MSIFNIPNIGRRNSYVTAQSTFATGTAAYDDDGRLVTTGTRNIIEFSADISEMKSDAYLDPTDPGRRNTRLIKLEADRLSVEDLTIDYTLTFDDNDEEYQIVDKYDNVHYFTATIIAQQLD